MFVNFNVIISHEKAKIKIKNCFFTFLMTYIINEEKYINIPIGP